MGDFGNLPSNCPPSDAKPTSNETVYRFIDNDAPQESDFRSLRSCKPDDKFPSNSLECQAHALSVYGNLTDADKAKKRIPRFRSSKIAVGNLNSNSGVIQNTPSRSGQSHHSWWIHIDQKPWKDFKAI